MPSWFLVPSSYHSVQIHSRDTNCITIYKDRTISLITTNFILAAMSRGRVTNIAHGQGALSIRQWIAKARKHDLKYLVNNFWVKNEVIISEAITFC